MSRDRFETWATNLGHDVRRYDGGEYVSHRTRELWACWQAAWAAASEEVAR